MKKNLSLWAFLSLAFIGVLTLILSIFYYETTYKRQSKNVQKWEFKNVQFYSLNISFKR